MTDRSSDLEAADACADRKTRANSAKRVAVALAISCAGLICGRIAHADPDFSCDFGTDGMSGLVIFYGTLPAGEQLKTFPEDFGYVFNTPHGSYFSQHGVNLRKANRTFYLAEATSDFTAQFGRVLAIQVHEGDYAFTSWS